MANLPSNTFMFNYNAREYNSSTHTFPKTQGQWLNEDLVLSNAPQSNDDVSVYFGNSTAYAAINFSTAALNPFNRDSSNSTFTFIYKTSGFTQRDQNLFANRSANYNYMVRGNMFHTKDSGFLSLTPSSDPQIVVIRIQANGNSERKVVDTSGNTLQSVSSATINWGATGSSYGVGFFVGYNTGGENFTDTFYWMYCSLEALTDAEINQVIAFNDTNFGVSETALTNDYHSTAFTVNLTAEENTTWSATTVPSWITVSPSTGSSTSATLTITFAKNSTYSQRTGTIVFTDSKSNPCEIECTQGKYPLLLPNNNIYRGGTIIN